MRAERVAGDEDWPSGVRAMALAKSSEPRSVIVVPPVAEVGVEVAVGRCSARADVVARGAGDDDAAVRLDDDRAGVSDSVPRSVVTIAVRAEARRRASRRCCSGRARSRCRRRAADGAAGDDDLAVGLHRDRVGLVAAADEVGRDDAVAVEAGVGRAVGRGSGRWRSRLR